MSIGRLGSIKKLGLGSKDKEWFDHFICDRWKMLFPKYEYYGWEEVIDLLYGEEIRRNKVKLGEIEVYISQRADPATTMTRVGFDLLQPFVAHIPKPLIIEYSMPFPREGDLIKIGSVFYQVNGIDEVGYILHLEYPIIFTLQMNRWRPEVGTLYVESE